jgi:hypothetical protein
MHPVRTVKNAVTPRPVKQLSRAVYTVTNPLGAAENKLIDTLLNGSGSRRSGKRSGGWSPPVTSRSASTEAHPRSVSTPTGGGTRIAEAVASTDRLAQLMAVQRERFAQSQRPIIALPGPVDPAPYRNAEWARRKGEIRFWQRSKRRRIAVEVEQFAQAQAATYLAHLRSAHQEQQAAADAWWHALRQGQPQVLTAALAAAFADNPAPVLVVSAAGAGAVFILVLPGIHVLPAKKAHITPTGRLSSKAWTKTELNEVYSDLLGAHLLATIREAWAVGCSLTQLRIIGVRREPHGLAEILFDVDVSRDQGQWNNDAWGSVVLRHSPGGLHRAGRTGEVQAVPQHQQRPDTHDLLGRLDPASPTN